MSNLASNRTALYVLKLYISGRKGKNQILRATISQKIADAYDIAAGDILDAEIVSHTKEGRIAEQAERVK